MKISSISRVLIGGYFFLFSFICTASEDKYNSNVIQFKNDTRVTHEMKKITLTM